MSVSNDGGNSQSPKKYRERVRIKRKQYAIRLGGKMYRQRFATAEQGRAWQRKMRMDFDARRFGLPVQQEPLTINEVVEKFLEHRKKLAARKHDEFRLRTYILPYFHSRKLNDIHRSEWTELFGEGDNKRPGKLMTQYNLSPRTSNMIRTLCHTLYEYARKNLECVSVNPIHDIGPQVVAKKRFRCLQSDTDIQKYLEACSKDNPSYFAFAMISLNTGLRMGNVVTLQWQDINFERGSITARRKFDYASNSVVSGLKAHDGAELELGLSGALRAFLLAWREKTKYSGPTDFVTASQFTGGMLVRSTLQSCHERAVANAGIAYFNVHGLRHTYATMFLERGGKLHDLKHILNHSSVTVTELYTHNLRNRLKETAEVMSVEMPVSEAEAGTENFSAKKVIALRKV